MSKGLLGMLLLQDEAAGSTHRGWGLRYTVKRMRAELEREPQATEILFSWGKYRGTGLFQELFFKVLLSHLLVAAVGYRVVVSLTTAVSAPQQAFMERHRWVSCIASTSIYVQNQVSNRKMCAREMY